MDSACFIHSALDEAGLCPSEFRVYAHLARRADNGTGEANPGIASMSEVCKLHPDTVRASVKRLQERHMIEAEDRPGKARIYRLAHPSTWVNPPEDNGGVGKESPPSVSTPPKAREGTPPSVSDGTPPKGMETKVLPEGNPQKDQTPPSPPAEPVLAASAVDEDDQPSADAPPAAAGGGEKSAEDAAKAARKAEAAAKNAVMLRLGKIHHRRSTTEWSEGEKKKLRSLYANPEFLPSVDEIEAYYSLPTNVFPRQERGPGFKDWRRKDLITLLNHWWGEVGLSRKFFEINPQQRPRAAASPNGQRPSREFLEWIKATYPTADTGLPYRRLVETVGKEFRAAHPNLPLAEARPC